MRLWTLQEKDAHQRLLDRGVLYGDWRRLDDRSFKPAYKWLCTQMEGRGIPLKGRPPMWAWAHKPDMRMAAHLYRGQHGMIRLELEVPDGLVLLSNYEAWHCVLNDHFLVTCGEEVEGMFDHPRDEVEESWKKIFDHELITGLPGYGDWTQATFPTIELDYVIKTWKFGPR
jgi:hypothetical protein